MRTSLKQVTLIGICCVGMSGLAAAQVRPSAIESSTVPAPPEPRRTPLTGSRSTRPNAPLGSPFRTLGSDLVRLTTPENAILFGIGGGLSLVGRIEERDLTAKAAAAKSLDGVFEAGDFLGGAAFQIGSALATYTVGRATGRSDIVHLGSDLIRAQILTQVVTQGIKLAVGRTRPDGTNYSFPSGHSAGTFATATVLQRHYGWKIGVPAYALAGYVAASRLQENRHFTSDVIFGATVGMLAGRSVTFGHGSHRFALAPLSTPGGVGVGLVKVPLR